MADEEADAERETMLTWIEASWEESAAFAWRGYVLDVRGIVLLQADWQGEVVVAYQTPGMAEERALGWRSEIHDAVQQYGPATDAPAPADLPATVC